MNKILLVVALCGAVAPPVAPPKIEPWPRYKFEGFIVAENRFELFAWGPKPLAIDVPQAGYFRLAFACEKDQVDAEKMIGQLVEFEGHLVRREGTQLFVPLTLREKTK